MARTTRQLSVGVDEVWAVLADGFAYAEWVVGTQRIESVDKAFPAVGTRLHYRAGLGPVTWAGDTEVIAVEDGVELRLEAKAWPLGTARIAITVSGNPASTQVTIDEQPHRGPGKLLHNPVSDALIDLRNREQLRRLERLASARDR